VTDTINDVFRSGALSAVIPPAPASPTAQTDNSGGPLNIRHIKRGHGFAVLTGRDANIQYSSTSWGDVAPELVLNISTSERPLFISATFSYEGGSSGETAFSFSVDNQEVTSRQYGLAAPFIASGVVLPYTLQWVATPGPGTHRIALVAKLSSGAGLGTIYCVNDVAVLTAREV
jgi:hypothetical protein